MSEIERLSGDFNRGYTRAIIDIMSVFSYIKQDLKYNHKSMTSKLADELLKCCLDNRENLREEIDGFIRWNRKDQKFEFYKSEKGVSS